jgi:hypothetical protein
MRLSASSSLRTAGCIKHLAVAAFLISYPLHPQLLLPRTIWELAMCAVSTEIMIIAQDIRSCSLKELQGMAWYASLVLPKRDTLPRHVGKMSEERIANEDRTFKHVLPRQFFDLDQA